MIQFNLTEQQKSRAALLLNVFLAATVGAYCVVGALAFMALETDYRDTEIQHIITDIKTCIADRLNNNETDKVRSAKENLELASDVFDLCTNPSLDMERWDFITAVVYTFTAVVTVGYDALEPKTTGGRLFAVVFTILGIPFTMVVVGNLGKYLFHLASMVYIKIRRKIRDLYPVPAETSVIDTGTTQGTNLSLSEDDEDEVPTMVVMLLMVGLYVLTGTLAIPLMDGVGFVQAIYNSVMTVTALDFGMIFRGHVWYVPFKLLYACVGLALVTIAIDIGGEYLRKLHFYGRKVDASKAKIWVGSQKVSMKHLVNAVGRQSGVKLEKMEQLNFDRIMKSAVAEEQGEVLSDEEELEIEDPRDRPVVIRHIDSTDMDTDYGGRDPPPPPPQPPGYGNNNEAMMDDNGSLYGRQGGNRSNHRRLSVRFNGNHNNWSLAQIQENDSDGTNSPEPRSITDTGIDTCPNDDDRSNSSDEECFDDGTPLLGSSWYPSPPLPASPRLIGFDWTPESNYDMWNSVELLARMHKSTSDHLDAIHSSMVPFKSYSTHLHQLETKVSVLIADAAIKVDHVVLMTTTDSVNFVRSENSPEIQLVLRQLEEPAIYRTLSLNLRPCFVVNKKFIHVEYAFEEIQIALFTVEYKQAMIEGKKTFDVLIKSAVIPLFPPVPGRAAFTGDVKKRHALYQGEWKKMTQRLLNRNKLTEMVKSAKSPVESPLMRKKTVDGNSVEGSPKRPSLISERLKRQILEREDSDASAGTSASNQSST